jgi:hypothetical protein
VLYVGAHPEPCADSQGGGVQVCCLSLVLGLSV